MEQFGSVQSDENTAVISHTHRDKNSVLDLQLLTDRKPTSFAHQISLHNKLPEQLSAPSHCTGMLNETTGQLFTSLISPHDCLLPVCIDI